MTRPTLPPFRACARLAAVALTLFACLPFAARADQFTPAQRAEIVQILRQALKSDPSILRDAVTALQADEAARQQAATESALVASHARLFADPADPVAGNPKGDVTIVEFYDTRCPYCRRMLPEMQALLQSDPHLRLVYKDLPVLGPVSQLESSALLAAQRQGGYLRLQEALMTDSAPSTKDSIRRIADGLGLDGARLLRDMQDPSIRSQLRGNIALAESLHIEGTPALIVGDKLIPGAVTLDELRQEVAAARKGQG
ncbi:MAG TPA: DsbA family protein [Acetobacteraceae bacterium]|nr:DsbA family protein [Acetobacteraceae bacterium]